MTLQLPSSPGFVGFVALYLAAALVSLSLAAYMYRHHWHDVIGRVFTLLVVSVAVWILGTLLAGVARFTLESNVYLAAKLFKFVGVMTAPLLLLLFALLYDGRYRWVRKPVVGALLVVPAATLPVIATTRAHGLFYEEFAVTSFGGTSALYVTVGPLFWAIALYGYALLVVASALVVYAGHKRWPYYRFETTVVVVGLAISWAVNLAYLLRNWPHPAVDPTPIGFVVTGLLFAVGVFSPRLMDIPVPVRIDVLDAIDDAIVVLDREDRVAAVNETAHRLLGADEMVGRPAAAVFPWDDTPDPDADPVVNEVDIDEEARIFKCRSLAVGPTTKGWTIVVLTDITDEMETQRLRSQRDALRERNEKLEVLNQIVGHDIRNDMNTLLMTARCLRKTADETERRESLDAITTRGEHVVDLANTIEDLMRTMLDDTGATRPVALADVLAREIDGFRSTSGSIAVPAPLPDVRVSADDMLGAVFRNLLRNAVEHGSTGPRSHAHEDAVEHADAPNPEITVTVDETTDDAVVRIADDGPGVPDGRKQAIFGRGEKGLESSGVGLGLYLVDTLVTEYGGDVWVEDNDPRGAVFVVRLPKVAPSDRIDEPESTTE